MKKRNSSQFQTPSDNDYSSSFIKKIIHKIPIDYPRQCSIITNPELKTSSSSFFFDKEIKILQLPQEGKPQQQNIEVSSKAFISQMIHCPDERLLYGTKRRLYIQNKSCSDEFMLISELTEFNQFTNVFFDQATQFLYIIIDYCLLFEYDMTLAKGSNCKDIQTLIDNRKIIQSNSSNGNSDNNSKSNKNTSEKKEKEDMKFLNCFREYFFLDESGKYAYRVAKNISLEKYGVIRFVMLLTYDIEKMQFKPNDNDSDYYDYDNDDGYIESEFALLENNAIRIFDGDSLICKTIIEPPIGIIKVFKYSLDGKYLLIILEDDNVYGIDLCGNRRDFCLEGHKSYVNDIRMTKSITQIEESKVITALQKSSFKEISYDKYHIAFSKEDINMNSHKEEKEKGIIEKKQRSIPVIKSSSQQVYYEIMTLGDDGFVGLWKYEFENDKNNNKKAVKHLLSPWNNTNQINKIEFTFASPKIIQLKQLVSSNDYIHLSPIEMINIVSRPLLSMHFISNYSLIILCMSSKLKFKRKYLFLQLEINLSKYFPHKKINS